MSDIALTVKDMHEDDQPREKAMKYGIGSLANSELLALVLGIGKPGMPITQITRAIMEANDHKLLNLERRSFEELLDYPAIGPAKALQIMSVMELVRRYSRERIGERVVISSPQTIFEYMRPINGNLPHEEIWVLTLNRANQVVGKFCASSGGATATVFDLKKIIRKALSSGAEGIVLCHNHPSGNLIPSGPDDAITYKLRDACKLMDLRFLDHLIITSDGFYSYHDRGRLS